MNQLIADYVYVDTYAVNSTGTSAALDSAKITRTGMDGKTERARYARIQPLTNPIKWCIGTDPVVGAGALGHLLATNDTLELYGAAAIAAFRLIDATAATHGAVQVTVGF